MAETEPEANIAAGTITAPTAPISPITPVTTPPTTAPTAMTPGQSITSTTPTIAVTVANVVGVLNFQLVVTDTLGQVSAAAVAQVTVQGPPTAALTATPSPVKEGGTITLDGANSKSTAPIANYTFTLEALPT
jgi:hypothetical protein